MDKKKQAEKELETMVKDLKEKIDKYDVDKKLVIYWFQLRIDDNSKEYFEVWS